MKHDRYFYLRRPEEPAPRLGNGVVVVKPNGRIVISMTAQHFGDLRIDRRTARLLARRILQALEETS